MLHPLRKSGAIAVTALLATSCAVRQPLATSTVKAPSPTVGGASPGAVVVPLSLPGLPQRSVQYAYDRNYINTVEVRLRDSLGHERIQYVTRNAYLSDSRAAGTVNLYFHNVMPGEFTLTVRSSHEPLLAQTGRISYDSFRDVFFLDDDGDATFDVGEREFRVIYKSGSTHENSKFLVFDPAHIDPDWIFPPALRTDTSSTAAGFGIGGATSSIVAGQTTTVAVQVGQMPQWAPQVLETVLTVTAGSTVSFAVKDGNALKDSDRVLVNAGATATGGIITSADFDASKLHVYLPEIDPDAATFSFTPTRATHPDAASAPTAMPLWLARGQAISEGGATDLTAPKIRVLPALVDPTHSHIYGLQSHVPAGGTSLIRYDLRDAYGNRVAGNVPDVNAVPLNQASMANSELALDYAVVSSTVRNGAEAPPFLLPGMTKGRVIGGIFTQGASAAGLMTEPATYSAIRADTITPSPFKLTKLDIPTHLFEANPGQFGAGAHEYRLLIEDNPANPGSTTKWLIFERVGGPVIATGSAVVDPNVANARTIPLYMPAPPEGVSPEPLMNPAEQPVMLWIDQAIDQALDHNTRFTVTDYGKRSIHDTDTVRVRVRQKDTALFHQDVTFGWSN